MGIFYSISVNEYAYKHRKEIYEILSSEDIKTKIYYKNNTSIYLVDKTNNQKFCRVINTIQDKIKVSVISDISETDFVSISQDIYPVKQLKDNLKCPLSLDKEIPCDNIKFDISDVKMMENLSKALFYNLYDDNLSYDEAYIHGLSYVSVKTLKTNAVNETSLHEKIVRSCLQNWYHKYPIYKKNLYNSYHLYFNFVKELIHKDDASFLKTYEPLSRMMLNDDYIYFVNFYLKEIKHKKMANKSYLKFLLTEIELTYNHPKYQETNYEKIYNLSKNLIEITSKLLKITCIWSLLYQIQVLTKNTSINNIFIYVNNDIKDFTLFVLETLGFYKFI